MDNSGYKSTKYKVIDNRTGEELKYPFTFNLETDRNGRTAALFYADLTKNPDLRRDLLALYDELGIVKD